MSIKNFVACLLLIVLVTCSENSEAQDPHFSQYFVSPMSLNPALIGKDVADMRISSVIRSQWWGSYIEPYYTTTVSFEKRLLVNRPGNNSLAIGASLISDASNGGLLKNNYFSAGLAYNKALDANGNELLGGGISLTYANRMIDAGKLLFQSQYGSMGFQRSMPSNDPVSIQGNHYWDVNAGIHYSKTKNNWGYDLGAAIFHAGTPQIASYNNESYNLQTRISLQGGLQFNQLHISAITELQGTNSIYTIGGVYKIPTRDETITSLNIGLWNRFGDALYPYAAIEGRNWLGGITYDIVNSKDKDWAQSVQSMEFSFVWKFGSVKHTASSVSRVIFY